MSEARELYYIEINKPWHKTRRAQIENYVSELEQQKAELVKFIKFIYEEGHVDDRLNNKCKELIKI